MPELDALLDQLAAQSKNRTQVFEAALSELKQLVADKQSDRVVAAIRSLAGPSLALDQALSLFRIAKSCRPRAGFAGLQIKLALLGSQTLTQLAELIDLFCFAGGIHLTTYTPPFGVFRQETLDPNSSLYALAPDAVFIAACWRDLAHWPELTDGPVGIEKRIADECNEWTTLWATIHSRRSCQIIHNNFDQPAWRQMANHEMRHPASMGNFITKTNLALQASAPPFVTIHDLDNLAAMLGRRAWGDERMFHVAKLPCPPPFLVEYAHSVASLILAQAGLSKKCLAVDLDNTLWGGVIGDDGLGGIILGQGNALGEAFVAFQRYLRKLKERGVIIAVCSQNAEAIAREPFLNHPEMALRLDDISCFVANWQDKPANLRQIAAQLNIGLNSIVFIDDNPAERAIVRKLLPEVAVPEANGPLEFIDTIERNRYFQIVSFAAEDLKRSGYYRENVERSSAAAPAQSIEEFLQSLDMSAIVEPIGAMNLERSAQLINKSNQFNLTTVRRSTAQVESISRDPQWITLTARLADRFGDNGLISVVLGEIEQDALRIDTWVMSCRVLKRDVEKLVLNELAAAAGSHGLRALRGRYAPTPRNELVRDLYPSLGFTTIASEADGSLAYQLELSRFIPLQTFIATR